jgi:uncharacterized protein YnzC (UPF0291/DUF896 family)
MEKYMHQKRLDRINELARKQKSERLTEAEKAEQKKLREEYLADFRKTLRGQLENITFVAADGSLTPLRTLRKKDN